MSNLQSKSPEIETREFLFIGGPADGRREVCEGLMYRQMLVRRAPDRFRREEKCAVEEFYLEVSNYRLERFRVAKGEYSAYVHTSIPSGECMKLLIDNYRRPMT